MANSLGSRAWYEYTSDTGTKYGYQTDEDLATAMGATPMTTNLPNLPRRFKPRVVLWEGEDEDGNKIRKELIAPTTTTASYATNGSTTIVVDGTSGTTTGRRGEQVSFPRLASVTPP